MYLQLTVALVVAIIALFYRWRKRQYEIFKKLGIHGPKPNLFFGNLLEIYLKGSVHCHRKWLEKYGRIYGYFNGTRPVLVVTDTGLLRNILVKDFQKFRDRPRMFNEIQLNDALNNHLANLKGKKWKDIRSLVTPSFTTSKMKMMSPIMNNAIDSLLENFEENSQSGETFDAFELYKRLTMDVIGRSAFGIHTNVQRNPKDPLLRLSRLFIDSPTRILRAFVTGSFPLLRYLVMFVGKIAISFANKGRDPVDELLRKCEAIIKARMEDPSKRRVDVLQLLIDAELPEDAKVEERSLAAGEDTEQEASRTSVKENDNIEKKKTRHLTRDELVSNAFIFLIAGYATTSTALAFVTMMLVNYPDVQEKLRQEVNDLLEKEGQLDYASVHKLQYLEQVFCEVLRMYPPAIQFVNREAAEDVQYGDLKIPKGMAVQASTLLLHYDPEYWSEPDKFIPERFSPENRSKNDPLAWQPFGYGPRNCVGMRFAQMEAKLTLARLLHKYQLLRAEETDKHPLQLTCGPFSISPKHGVPIKVKECKTTS